MQKNQRVPKSSVSKELALDHALVTIRRAWSSETPDFKEWGKFELDEEKPIVLYDINGQKLFYEFNVIIGDNIIGSVKTSASKMLGSAVPAIQLSPRKWNPEEANNQAKEKVSKMYPEVEIIKTEFVCYSYPKVGVRIYMKEPEIGKRSIIFDAADFSQIEEFGPDGPMGQAAWSFYERISDKNLSDRKTRWEKENEEIESLRSDIPKIFDRTLTDRELKELKPKFKLKSKLEYPYIISPYSFKTVPFSPRCNTHDCFELYAQKTNVYCAVATGQMLLDFYRYYYSQIDIAAAMGTGPSGTYISGMLNGLNQLSKKCLDATWDGTASWNEAKAEIDNNKPLASIIPGHARACAGWKRQNICIWPGPCKKWLKIYDPWPWSSNICNGGAIYWEDWDLQTHWGFVYLRSRSTPCT
jgi:hypothetical protein